MFLISHLFTRFSRGVGVTAWRGVGVAWCWRGVVLAWRGVGVPGGSAASFPTDSLGIGWASHPVYISY